MDWKSLEKKEAHDRMVERDNTSDFQKIPIGGSRSRSRSGVGVDFMRSESESESDSANFKSTQQLSFNHKHA